jgi:tetratricopeptide (TPR) repeat protein
LDAGLSMSQLAGDDLTKQAISLIENGRARPSRPTLEIIASRTGRPVASFLRAAKGNQPSTPPVGADGDVERLQALCLQQQFDKAVALGLQMLERPMAPRVEARVRHYVGQALARLTRPDEALEHLRRAQVLLVAEPDPWLAVECADWEASALYLKEDSRALAVAEKALKLCRATKPSLPGTEARILEHIATIHVKNHTYDRAIAFYQEALQAAGAVRDLARLGRTYHGLSIAYQERGDLGRAIEFTHKALALYALEHDTALLARGENELGLLLMRQGHMAQAEEAFRTALAHLDEAGTDVAKSHVLLSLGELQLNLGRNDDGIAMVKQAIDLAKRLDERLALGSGCQLLGQLYERAGRRALADREFRIAMRLFRTDGLNDRLAESHAAYAEMLERRGDSRGSSRHWKQAAKLALRKQPTPAGVRAV